VSGLVWLAEQGVVWVFDAVQYVAVARDIMGSKRWSTVTHRGIAVSRFFGAQTGTVWQHAWRCTWSEWTVPALRRGTQGKSIPSFISMSASLISGSPIRLLGIMRNVQGMNSV